MPTHKRGRKIIDLTGKKFGHLRVKAVTEDRILGNPVWKCKCDCGNIVYIRGSYFKDKFNPRRYCSMECPFYQEEFVKRRNRRRRAKLIRIQVEHKPKSLAETLRRLGIHPADLLDSLGG